MGAGRISWVGPEDRFLKNGNILILIVCLPEVAEQANQRHGPDTKKATPTGVAAATGDPIT